MNLQSILNNQINTYLIIALITIIAISMLQRGFFWTWLRARLQPQKTIVIKCYGGKKPYYRNGRIEPNPQRIVFQDLHSKQYKSIIISNASTQIHIEMGVQYVVVDTQKDCVIDFGELAKAINGHDGEKYEGLCLRHLYRPSLMEDQLKKQLILLIIILLAIIGNFYYTYKLTKGVEFVSTQIGNIQTTLNNMTGRIIWAYETAQDTKKANYQ